MIEKRETSVVESMIAAPESLNPAITLHLELQRLEREGGLSAGALLVMSDSIEKAIEAGRQETQQVSEALRVLQNADPQPSIKAPMGF
ncbi:MAG: hypothetical protein WBV94_18550 [Blastocatellia bacterium]